VIDLLAEIPALGRGVPTRVYAYLIPLPAFAMVVRVLINSETSILFTVAASVLSAAAASGSWPALLFLLLSGTAGAARARRVPDRYRMLMAGVQSWCEANRDELTHGGKSKSGDFVTGAEQLIVPTLRVGTHPSPLQRLGTLERPGRHSHAERGNDKNRA
jgi:hypothetical protein